MENTRAKSGEKRSERECQLIGWAQNQGDYTVKTQEQYRKLRPFCLHLLPPIIPPGKKTTTISNDHIRKKNEDTKYTT